MPDAAVSLASKDTQITALRQRLGVLNQPPANPLLSLTATSPANTRRHRQRKAHGKPPSALSRDPAAHRPPQAHELDQKIQDVYKRIQTERRVLEASQSLRQATTNPEVLRRNDATIREAERSLHYFEDTLRELQSRKLMQTQHGDHSRSGSMASQVRLLLLMSDASFALTMAFLPRRPALQDMEARDQARAALPRRKCVQWVVAGLRLTTPQMASSQRRTATSILSKPTRHTARRRSHGCCTSSSSNCRLKCNTRRA